MIERYKRVIIWGVHRGTHVHIHRHFNETLQRLGIEVRWVENDVLGNLHVQKGDLVIAAWDSSHLRYREDVDYCLHNFYFPRIRYAPNIVYLQIFMDLAGRRFIDTGPTYTTYPFYDSTSPEGADYEEWSQFVLWNPVMRVLVQPWGTPTFAEDFGSPAWNPWSRDIAFVGSVWDNAERMGNVSVIKQVVRWCQTHYRNWHHPLDVSDLEAAHTVGRARLAPAVGGEFQDELLQLPCRGFKNISTGALGFTNLTGFHQLLGDCTPVADTIDELMDVALSINRSDTLEMVWAQQQIVKEHTYVQRLNAIARAMES